MKRLLAAKKEAEGVVAEFSAARSCGALAQDDVTDLTRRFIWAKFRLNEQDVQQAGAGDDLEALAQASLAKMLRIAPDLVGQEDKAASCDGADSSTVKQALMIMALQKEFDVQLNGFMAGRCKTVPALAALVWEAL